MIITFSLTVVPFNLIFLHLIHSYDILYHSYTFISQSWLTLTFKKKKNPNSWPIRLLLYLTLDRVKPNKEKVLNHVSFFFFLVFPFNTEVTSMMGMRQTNSGMHPTWTLMLIHIWAWWKRRRGRRNTQTPLNVTILSVRSLPQRRCGKQLKLFSGWHPKNLQKLITDFNHYCADFIRVGPGGGGGGAALW